MKKILTLLLILPILLSGCVKKIEIVKVDIAQLPTKLVYILGQDTALDLSGLTIKLTTNTEKTSIHPFDEMKDDLALFSVTHAVDFTKVGTYPVTVTHSGGLSIEFNVEVKLPPYVDDNPITINFYDDDTRDLITNPTGIFQKDVDIVVFSVFFTDVNNPGAGRFSTVFNKYWNQYTGIEEYKIGFTLTFKLKTGETYQKIILGPHDEPDSMWDYIRIYLYDDIHQTPGVRYSHLLERQVTDQTLLTSIKLTGNSKTQDIDGNLTLSAFTYNGDEDFDPITGLYRGKSIVTLTITPQ
jgi:hypothetical protein